MYPDLLLSGHIGVPRPPNPEQVTNTNTTAANANRSQREGYR